MTRSRGWWLGWCAFIWPALASAQQPVDASPAGPDAEVGGFVPEAAAPDSSSPAPDVAEPRPDTPATFGPIELFPLADGIQVTVQAPSDWPAGDAEMDVAAIQDVPGARVQVARVWAPARPRSGRLLLVCASAPSREWAHGIESLVFERLNSVASAELARYMTVSEWSSDAIEETPFGFQQGFRGRGTGEPAVQQGGVRVLEPQDEAAMAAPPLVVTGRHSLAFSATEDPPLVLTCSIACAEPVFRHGAVCNTVLAAHHLQGRTGPEPVPSLRTRFVVGFGRRPIAFGGLAAGLASLLVGVVAVVRGLLLPARS
jgi:hypothetical protein